MFLCFFLGLNEKIEELECFFTIEASNYKIISFELKCFFTIEASNCKIISFASLYACLIIFFL